MLCVPLRHVRHQGPVVAAMGRSFLASLAVRWRRPERRPPATPGPEIVVRIPPPPADLVADFVRHVGGDPAVYAGNLPPHFFPQFGVPLLARTLDGAPYDLLSVVNAGCAVDIRAPLPADRPLRLRAWLDRVDDDGRRVVLTQRLEIGPDSGRPCLSVVQTEVVPARRRKGEPRRRERVRVPTDARAIGRFRVGLAAGLEFGILTGDFNPLHWLAPYAWALGYRMHILQGFSTLARAVERVRLAELGGDPARLARVEARFVAPLVLPADVGVFVDAASGLWVGPAAGAPALLAGRFAVRPPATPR